MSPLFELALASEDVVWSSHAYGNYPTSVTDSNGWSGSPMPTPPQASFPVAWTIRLKLHRAGEVPAMRHW